jgi:hypothetical protein
MKTIAVLAASAFLSVTVLSSFSAAYAAAPGAMSGKGPRGTSFHRSVNAAGEYVEGSRRTEKLAL